MTEDTKAQIRMAIRRAIDSAIEKLTKAEVECETFGENIEYHMTEAACIPLFTQIEACEMKRDV